MKHQDKEKKRIPRLLSPVPRGETENKAIISLFPSSTAGDPPAATVCSHLSHYHRSLGSNNDIYIIFTARLLISWKSLSDHEWENDPAVQEMLQCSLPGPPPKYVFLVPQS